MAERKRSIFVQLESFAVEFSHVVTWVRFLLRKMRKEMLFAHHAFFELAGHLLLPLQREKHALNVAAYRFL
jgi:hypothetical protein